MQRNRLPGPGILILILFPLVAALALGAGETKPAVQAEWAMNATIIEACSCPMFCQCYFNPEPAEHTGHGAHGEHHGGGDEGHFCKFNNAFQVNRGHHGDVQLDGAKFWVAGDLGANLADGRMDWAVLTFDPAVTPEQRKGIGQILGHLYPVQWDSFEIAGDAKIEWTAGKDQSVARLAGGKKAEVVLNRMAGNTDDPVVIRNLKYWGAPRNDGFVLMPNEVQAYRGGERPFEYRGTNGFMITFDLASSDVAK
ncbi:MAG TPA: DUF1326 domain-containing protein [Thermoanaerobaculia bacterium]|nr:DUF1326 domain-containing protein [Thermoanaerobaculia bacterium]